MCHYNKLFTSREGRPPISGRIVLGAVVIKHFLNLSDRETIAQIRENMLMQYFLGYSSFTNEEPFSPALFVEIRERLRMKILSKINDVIVVLCIEKEEVANQKDKKLPVDPPVELNQPVGMLYQKKLPPRYFRHSRHRKQNKFYRKRILRMQKESRRQMAWEIALQLR